MSKEKSTYLPGFSKMLRFENSRKVENKKPKFSAIELDVNMSELKEMLKQHPQLSTKREYKGELSTFISIKIIPNEKDGAYGVFSVLQEPWNPKSGSKNSKKQGKKKKKKDKK